MQSSSGITRPPGGFTLSQGKHNTTLLPVVVLLLLFIVVCIIQEHQLSMELNECKLKYETVSVRSKTERKILSNEVKALRKEVETLTSERDVHAYQLQLLRDAFNVTATKISAVSKHNV